MPHDPLHALILHKLQTPVDGATAFVDDIRRTCRHPDEEPQAILLYGSTLSALTRATGSIPDVYVITQKHRRFHRSWLHAALNTFLAPNVYFRTFDRGDQTLSYKLCVISKRQLLRETSANARDLHHLGRFSKRMALAWARDASVTHTVASCAASSLRALTPHALARLPERFTLQEFALTLLGLSYAAETRVSENTKVEALWQSERDYYQQVFTLLLAEANLSCARTGDAYTQPLPPPFAHRAVAQLLARSRRRERLRWPKYMFTFDNWVDYVLAKLERHQGIKLVLTERERRYPLIFAWGKYFALKRRGVVK